MGLPDSISRERMTGLHVVAVAAVLACAAWMSGGAAAHVALGAAAPAATLRDPANDVRVGCRPHGHLDLEAGRQSDRALHGAPADYEERELHGEHPGGCRVVGARREARRRRRLLLALQPLDRDDDERHRGDSGPHRDREGSNLGVGRADERDVGPNPRVLPGRARERQERRRRPCRHHRPDDLVLPHGSPTTTQLGRLHLAGPGSLTR